MAADAVKHKLAAISDEIEDRIRNSGGQVIHYAGDTALASF